MANCEPQHHVHNTGFVVVLVLYILLAIILGSVIC